MQFSLLLSELVAVSHWLELWRVDTLLHGELCLKHCCILEAKAESRDPPGTVDGVPVTFMRYDRSQLLLCCQELERVDSFIKLAREREMRGGVGGKEEVDGAGAMEGEELSTDLAILHAECVYALIRVQVKLASTNPPPGETGGPYTAYGLKAPPFLMQISLTAITRLLHSSRK